MGKGQCPTQGLQVGRAVFLAIDARRFAVRHGGAVPKTARRARVIDYFLRETGTGLAP